MSLLPISPSELLKVVLEDESNPQILPYVVVGGADDTQQNAGVVSIMDAGTAKPELYVPLLWVRAQLRCIGPNLAAVDAIGRHIYDVLHNHGRKVVEQPSTGNTYLIHGIYIGTGPSHHFDSAETYEDLLFATVCIGSVPVVVSS